MSNATGHGERDYVYLDHAATAPLRDCAREAMTHAWDMVGNASAVHGPGRAARRLVEESREAIAAALGADPVEVVFTSGGTEADNLAIAGMSRALEREADGGLPRIVTTDTEHAAVLGTALRCERDGRAELTRLPVSPDGSVTAEALIAAIGGAAAPHEPPAMDEARDAGPGRAGGGVGPAQGTLVSIQTANSEFGTVQDVPALVAQVRAWHRSAPLGHALRPVLFHSDAVQALGQVPLDFAASELDAMSISGHKVGGPAGVGALIVRRGAPIEAISGGGSQERNLRPGTYDVAGIAGMAASIVEAVAAQPAEASRLAALRDELASVLLAVDGVALTGPDLDARLPSGTPARLPGNLHVRISGARSELLLFALDAAHVAAAAGSACHAGVTAPSAAVLALGFDEAEAGSSLRFSLGHTTTPADIAFLAEVWSGVVSSARTASATLPAAEASTNRGGAR